MTYDEHFAEAERLMKKSKSNPNNMAMMERAVYAAQAQVHATLALADVTDWAARRRPDDL